MTKPPPRINEVTARAAVNLLDDNHRFHVLTTQVVQSIYAGRDPEQAPKLLVYMLDAAIQELQIQADCMGKP